MRTHDATLLPVRVSAFSPATVHALKEDRRERVVMHVVASCLASGFIITLLDVVVRVAR